MLSQIFKDEKGELSWYRCASTFLLPVVSFCMVWSTVALWEPGLLVSGSLIAGIMGLKVLQKKVEKS